MVVIGSNVPILPSLLWFVVLADAEPVTHMVTDPKFQGIKF